jgi:Tfp pilus assembly pilus retraction ATPase PilT
MTLDEILDAADEHRASDVFLQEGELPRLKINEEIMLFGEEPLELQQMAGLWRSCGADPNTDMDKDSGLVSRARTRYRVNLHRILGRLGAVMRRIRTDIPQLETLGAPTQSADEVGHQALWHHPRHRTDRHWEVHHSGWPSPVDERHHGAPHRDH